MGTGLRREQVRGLELDQYLTEVTAGDLNPSIFGAPVAIDADDTQSSGVAATISRSDHQHAWTCGSAADLTKTATSSEGAATTGARSDHVHSTAALPWGWIAGFTSNANGAVLASGGTTDFAFDVTPLATRRYRFCVSGQTSTSGVTAAAVRWRMLITLDGTETFQSPPMYYTGNQNGWFGFDYLWLPAADTYTVAATMTRDAGDGSIQWQGNATKLRAMWVEDIGAR